MGQEGFMVSKCTQGAMVTTVHAHMEKTGMRLTACLDNQTGEVFYPVRIAQDVLGIEFVLDSATGSSCSFPPTVPGDMVDGVAAHLGMFHAAVSAARGLIKREQEGMAPHDGSIPAPSGMGREKG